MAHDPTSYADLHRQFIEAAAEHELEGYRLSIERGPQAEDSRLRTGRREAVGWICWPYKPRRKCAILAPVSGSYEAPFCLLKRLATKAWLWLPKPVMQGVIATAERHLAVQEDIGLWWARHHYQFWLWVLWFDWFQSVYSEEIEEPENPAAGMDLQPFSSSASLIVRWGLDGSNPSFPAWSVPGVAAGNTSTAKKPKRSTVQGEAETKLIAALTNHHQYTNGSCMEWRPVGVRELHRLADVSPERASTFFKTNFESHDKYKAACLNKDRQWMIAAQLKVLNDEFSIFRGLVGDPLGEDGQEPERDDEE